MADTRDDQKQVEAVSEFEATIAALRYQGVYSHAFETYKPWEDVPETQKLGEILMESWSSSNGYSVPGTVALAAIERNVDYAGLPAVQRELLLDLRTKLDAGQLDEPLPGRKDAVVTALTRIHGIEQFEAMLERRKQEDELPWRELSEADKVIVMMGIAWEAGSPGAYTLAAIQREVDYGKLPSWRREALETVRSQLDGGELDGEIPDPSYIGDRVDLALRLDQEARIEQPEHFGIRDDQFRRFDQRELSDAQKLGEINVSTRELHLGSKAKTYEIIAREVDMTRAPEDPPRQFEGSRSESALGNPDRDDLIRETYRLNHELGYIGFRHQYFNDPDAIKEWPDPAIRERELRSFWDNEHEGRFASYREDFAKDSVEVLTAYRDHLRGLLAGDRDGQVAYYKQVSEAGRGIRLHKGSFSEVKAADQSLPSPAAIADDRDCVPTPEGASVADKPARYDSPPESIELARKLMGQIKEALTTDADGKFPAKYADMDWEGMNMHPEDTAWQHMDMGQRYDLLLHALDESIWSLEQSAKWDEMRDSQKLAIDFVKEDVRQATPGLRADAFDAVMTRLKVFADEFTRIARTNEQTSLAENFGKFVGDEGHIAIAWLAEARRDAALEVGRTAEQHVPSPGELAEEDRGGPEPPGNGPERGRGRQ
jgi:hypothetical protein